MDEMVDIVNAYCENKLTEEELGSVAAYIAGESTSLPASVKSKAIKRNYYYSVSSIAGKMNAKLKPEHYPRLRNLYSLLREVDHLQSFFRNTDERSIKHLSPAYENAQDYVTTVIAIFESTQTLDATTIPLLNDLMEAMYTRDPELLNALSAGLDRITNMFATFYMLHKDYARYKYVEEFLRTQAKLALNSSDKNVTYWFYIPFMRYSFPESAVTALFKEVYTKDPHKIINTIHEWARYVYHTGGWSNVANYTGLCALLDSMGCDIAPLFQHYATQNNNAYYYINSSNGIFDNDPRVLEDRFDDIRRAADSANTRPKLRLYAYLSSRGQNVDMAKCEEALKIQLKTPNDPFTHYAVGSFLGKSDTATGYLKSLLDGTIQNSETTVQNMFIAYSKNADIKTIDNVLPKIYTAALLKALAWMKQYYSTEHKEYDNVMQYIARNHFDLYKKTMNELDTIDQRLYMAMNLPKDVDGDTLIDMLGDKSKKINNIAFDILAGRREMADKIRPLVNDKKKSVREIAERLIMLYDGGDNNAAAVDIATFSKKYGKNIDSALKWTNPENWPKVRLADSDKNVDDETLKYYVYQFINSKTMDLPAGVLAIAEGLNRTDLHALAADIYSQWMNGGAEAKKKGALLLMGVNANDGDITALRKQIDTWADASRGALAAEAVRAMALSGRDLALMYVDSISAKFKNKQVRKAAVDSFAVAATALGLTPEQLADKIIPDLGFNQRGEKLIDYGTRTFTAVLTPALTVELKDENGKAVKSLPKPGAKDDQSKAEAAKTEFSALKKSLKSVVSTQALRLEQALSIGRLWDVTAWENLFVKNPIMHSFAMGLVWGFYNDNKLENTFRYMDDGSLTDADENELKFEDYKACKVGLVHPLELDEETKGKWNTQMEDYEIVQPVLQLNRAIYLPTEEEMKADKLERFGGVALPGITLISKLTKMGWSKGSVQDAGCFGSVYKEFRSLKIGVQLNHSYMYVGLSEMDEDATMGQAVFYKDEVERGNYVYDEPTDFIPLKDVPAKLFSEVVYELTEASKTSTHKDEGWRKEVGQF